MYLEAKLLNLPIFVSDQSPILLITLPTPIRKPIKMEAWCLDFKEVTPIISNHWHQSVTGSPMFTVAQKCRQVRYNIFKWCKNYKKQHNICWEELLNQCGAVQASLSQSNRGTLDEKVRKANIDKLEIQ